MALHSSRLLVVAFLNLPLHLLGQHTDPRHIAHPRNQAFLSASEPPVHASNATDPREGAPPIPTHSKTCAAVTVELLPLPGLLPTVRPRS